MAADKIPTNLVVGARVVLLNREDQGLGTVRYVGISKFAPGNWIGIEMDRAVGKNDGTVQGVKYFACKPNFGIFVKPTQVVVQVKKPAIPPMTNTVAPTTATKAETKDKTVAPSTDTSRSTSPIPTRTDEEKTDSASSPVVTTAASSGTSTTTSDNNDNTKTTEHVTESVSEPGADSKGKNTSAEDSTGVTDVEPDDAEPDGDNNHSKQPLEDTDNDPRDEPSTTSTAQGDDDDETEYVAELKTQIARLQKVREEEKKKYEEQIKLLKENAQNMNKSLEEQEDMRGFIKQLRQSLEQTMEQKNEAEKQLKILEKKLETSASKTSSGNTAEIERLKKQLEEIKEEYEEKINSLSDDLELVTIDKEFAEEKAENLQMEMNEVKKELEVLHLYKQSTEDKEKKRMQDIENGTVSTQSAEEVKILVAQNERLKEALMKLKDISLSEKQEQERHVQILEKELEVIPSLKGDIGDLMEKLDTKEKQIEALKSDLDELKDLQDKFEELFDKHMNLQEENKDLKTTIEELEQLRELADEVEESQSANEKKLRSDLYQKQVELLDKETKLINVQHSLKETEDAIEKLKQVVVDQKKSLEQAKERDVAMNERLHELEETARVVSQMNIQISLEKMKAALRDIEDELRGLEVKQARQEVALYKMFLPEEQLKKDQEVVQLQLMMERVSIKCDLVLNYLQKQYQLESLDNLLELDPFAQLLIKLYSMLYRFGYNAQYFLATLRVCDEELYLKLGRLVNEFHGYELQLDQLVELIKSEKLSKDTSIAEIQKSLDRFDTMAHKYLTPDVMPYWRRWQWLCHDLFCTHRSLVFEQLRLEQLLTLVRETRKSDNAQEHVLVTPFVNNDIIRTVLDTSRKLIRALRDRNLKEVRATQETLEHFQYNAKLVLDLLVEINRKVKVEFDEGHELDEAHLYKIVKDIPQFVSLWDIIATQLGQAPLSAESEAAPKEEGAEPVPENTRNDFATRLELLDKYYKQAIQNVQVIDDNLSRGAFDAEVDASATTAALTPMQKRAEQLKAELNQAAALKKELEELKAEIQEKERILRNKNQLIEESQWKEKKLEVKITSLESTVKESQDKIEELQQIFANKERIYEQAVKSLQNNLQTLEHENGALKGKMDNMELKAKEAQQLLQTTAAKAEETISIRAFNTQLASMRTAVEILKRENIKLKARAARDSLNQKLPQLPRLALNARTEAEKQTQNVLQSIQASIATNLVVDLSQGSKQARDQFIDHQQRRAQLRKTALECASKSGRDQHLLNKAAWAKPILAGRIELNRGEASKNVVKVVVSHQQLQQIHSSLV